MIKKLKAKIAAWFFRDEIAELELDRARFNEHKDSLSIQTLVFQKLKGFDMNLLSGIQVFQDKEGGVDVVSDILEDVKRAGYTEEAFLAETKKIADNWAFPLITSFFVRNQIATSFRAARTNDENNFGRALVLGVELVRDEVKRLKTLFDERNAEPDKLTPEEQNEVV